MTGPVTDKDLREWHKTSAAFHTMWPSSTVYMLTFELLVLRDAKKLDRLLEAVEYCAEEHDAGRHDGLPEPCPAHSAEDMWLICRAALGTVGTQK